MKKISPPSLIPTDPENWSESSKRSYIYESPPKEYRDHHYECWRCKQPGVYSAQEQQATYEVRKAYIWQKRTLCTDCFRVRTSIEAELRKCNVVWQQEKPERLVDAKFQERWLSLLQEHVHYGGKADEGNTQMLKSLLGKRDALYLPKEGP